jgi:hypothetical protein
MPARISTPTRSGWVGGTVPAGSNPHAIQANKCHDPKARVVSVGSMTIKATGDPGAAINSCTTSSGDQEAMTKATMRPRRIGRLTNHHRTNSTVMTGTVAPRHTISRRGHKTMTTTTLGRTLHQDKTTFLAGQVS